jgi:aerotaxis receptor
MASDKGLQYFEDGEVRFSRDYFILSETDAKGIIQYANDNFYKISGYRKDDVIHQPQNIVRHPDMPRALFKDLWKSIGRKGYWQGYIKNLRKDGKYYWVHASILKTKSTSGKVSYLSTAISVPKTETGQIEKLYKSLD